MYVSKKKKMILLATIPAAVVISTVSIAAPIVVLQENKIYRTIDEAENYQPRTVSESKLEELISSGLLAYNPNDFSKKFFVDNIANQVIEVVDHKTNKVSIIHTNSLLFDFENKGNNQISYIISNVYLDDNNNLVAKIDKVYLEKSGTYTQKIGISNGFFNESLTPESEKGNFLNYASDNFKKRARDNSLFVSSTVSDVNQINSDNLTLNGRNGISVSKSNSSYVISSDKSFLFNNEYVDFNFPVNIQGQKTIWNVQDAWPLKGDNTFDSDKSKAIIFLKTVVNDLYLPELTNEEKAGLTTEEAIQNKKLEKFLFDASKDPYELKGNQKIPNTNYYAILVKLSLGNKIKYSLTWQNVNQSAQSDIVNNAPELTYKTKKLGWNEWPSAEDIVNNFNLVELTGLPNSNDLEYRVIGVEIPQNDNSNNDIVNLTVEIRSRIDSRFSKMYSTRIDKGIKSKQQIVLDSLISNLLKSDINNLVPIIPTGKVNNSYNSYKDIDDLIVQLNKLLSENNFDEFNKLVSLTYKDGISGKIVYVPIFVNKIYSSVEKKYKLIISYQVTSPDNSSAVSAIISSVEVEVEFS